MKDGGGAFEKKQKKNSTPPQGQSQNLTKPQCVTIFHRGMASFLTNREEMEHLALPLTVKKIYSSLCACICGSWQDLPQPLLQGHGLNCDPWGWLYHSSLAPFFSLTLLSLTHLYFSLPYTHTHRHRHKLFITPSCCFFRTGHLASSVAYPDNMFRTIQERKKKSAFWEPSAGLITVAIEQDVTDRNGHQSSASRDLKEQREMLHMGM